MVEVRIKTKEVRERRGIKGTMETDTIVGIEIGIKIEIEIEKRKEKLRERKVRKKGHQERRKRE